MRQPADSGDYVGSSIWTEILQQLDVPARIQAELDRRTEAAKKADPLRKREESLHANKCGFKRTSIS